ncbi:hypothetical protein E4V99_13685 [Microbacterium sp. dk485]|uniref:hypothetical protein n=1 Tax=Microbacterium sp. dk485 TaxID=2560021 RepID=UPI001073B758|nr:hypothetical protein [Microbacterium sp. dk485]TFV81988.1 hypothetical protein E4V99_13685 [Microbacterium sp. dk485]
MNRNLRGAQRALAPADAATRAELHAADFLAWALAEDAHLESNGELHRRALRDRAARALDRDAAAIARGIPARRSDLEWLAQQLPEDHPHRAAVRALAQRSGVPASSAPAQERIAALRAACEHAAAELRALMAAAVPLALRAAHAGAARAALRAVAAWRRPCAPRAPAPAGLV